MHAFDYCNPTHIVFGAGRVSEVGEIAKQFGKRVMFVTYDKGQMESIGLLHKGLDPLKEAGLEVLECYGVKSNPSLFHGRELVEKAKEFKPDVMVAMGGGSVIDECKCIAASIGSGRDIWEMVRDNTLATEALPLIAISTIPATSSENNNIAVISNDEDGRKDGIESPCLYPKYAILDPELTRTIPLRQTAYSAADICSHLLEGYLSHDDPFVPMQNRYFEGMIKTQMDCMERLLEDPTDLEARSMMMWAAAYSWNGFCVLGIGPFESMIHCLGHIFSEMYDLPHGATMAMIIPHLMTFNVEKRKVRYARIARKLFGVDEDDDLRAAKQGIRHMKAWLDHIGAPTSMKAAGIEEDGRFEEMCQRAWRNVEYYECEEFYTYDDMVAILEMVRQG